MFRDIEHDAVGSVELDLDVAAGRILVRLEEAFGAESLDLRDPSVEIAVDEHAEVMRSGVIEALAELVESAGLELQQSHIEGAVCQVVPVGLAGAELADFLEGEGALIEFCGGVGVARRQRDMTNPGHLISSDRLAVERYFEIRFASSMRVTLLRFGQHGEKSEKCPKA